VNPQEELTALIGDFSSGRDRSMRLVGEIERILNTEFLDSPVYELLAEPVSLYRPGGGRPYIEEGEMLDVLLEARDLLND
jgi:hypothetical protein